MWAWRGPGCGRGIGAWAGRGNGAGRGEPAASQASEHNLSVLLSLQLSPDLSQQGQGERRGNPFPGRSARAGLAGEGSQERAGLGSGAPRESPHTKTGGMSRAPSSQARAQPSRGGSEGWDEGQILAFLPAPCVTPARWGSCPSGPAILWVPWEELVASSPGVWGGCAVALSPLRAPLWSRRDTWPGPCASEHVWFINPPTPSSGQVQSPQQRSEQQQQSPKTVDVMLVHRDRHPPTRTPRPGGTQPGEAPPALPRAFTGAGWSRGGSPPKAS